MATKTHPDTSSFGIWSFFVLFCFRGVCQGWRIERSEYALYCGSPIDIRESLVTGVATINFNEELGQLRVPVKKSLIKTDNMVSLKLLPLLYPYEVCQGGRGNLCHLRSEIRWIKTDEGGSAHTLEGNPSVMEIQHYFKKSNTSRIAVSVRYSLNPKPMGGWLGPKIPLAVGAIRKADRKVGYTPHKPNQSEEDGDYEEENGDRYDKSYDELPTRRQAYPLIRLEEMFKNKVSSIELDLRAALPASDIYYQYIGSDPTNCGGDHVVWVVYKEELKVEHSFLRTLRSLTKDDLNQYPMSPNTHKKLLMWPSVPEKKIPTSSLSLNITDETTSDASTKFLNCELFLLMVILLIF